MTTALDDETIEVSINRMREVKNRRELEMDAMLAGSPRTSPCAIHGVDRELSRELSVWAKRAAYVPCPTCEAERTEAAQVERIHRAGVPQILCNATLENWIPETEADAAHLRQVRAFIQTRRGFLVMLGELGTGKSYLAAAITRHFANPHFIKQSELLRRLRQTYSDKAERDPVKQAQDANLLVLDEMGMSAGGRDELPMLHDILDHRYNERKPTVLTGNITLEQFKLVIGERMTDRLREAAFAILMFGGESHRHKAKKRYFE
jgi:DNA replication protein DnaC